MPTAYIVLCMRTSDSLNFFLGLRLLGGGGKIVSGGGGELKHFGEQMELFPWCRVFFIGIAIFPVGHFSVAAGSVF